MKRNIKNFNDVTQEEIGRLTNKLGTVKDLTNVQLKTNWK